MQGHESGCLLIDILVAQTVIISIISAKKEANVRKWGNEHPLVIRCSPLLLSSQATATPWNCLGVPRLLFIPQYSTRSTVLQLFSNQQSKECPCLLAALPGSPWP